MVKMIFPAQIDNSYRGHKIALWIFGLIVLLKSVMSVNSIIMGHNVAVNADGIPVDSYSPAAAQTVLSLFASVGLANLIVCLVSIVALVRYRAMVPLMFALLLFQQLSRYLIVHYLPIVRVGTPPGTLINLLLLTLMVVGLALSLWTGGKLYAQK